MPSQGSQPLRIRQFTFIVTASLLQAAPAFAHASERGQIMLLPTHLFILGGTLAVAASVGISAFQPKLMGFGTTPIVIRLPAFVARLPVVASLLSLTFVLSLIAAGFWGPPDPISNPLPGTLWSIWWVGLTWLTLLVGNLWSVLNPWTGITAMLKRAGWKPLFALPQRIDRWPAVALFFAFAWFELVYPTPADPHRLAAAILIYIVFTFSMLFLFGEVWLKLGECFSIYFWFVSLLSPLQWRIRRRELEIGLPGFAILNEKVVSNGLAALIILALAAVSFDGFSRTFFWVSGQGLNPLEFPGRSAVVLSNTFAFAVMFACMLVIVRAAINAGNVITGVCPLPKLVLAVVPIAFAYHLAHYLPEFPVAVLQLAKAFAGLWGGGEGINPPASIMMDHDTAALIFTLQTAVIVLGHAAAVFIAHAIALNSVPSRAATISQLPLNAVMIAYTTFGLWLLSTPVVS